ncbi:MAG: fumarate hydratase [Omnitrophica WOR_2 bacterium SM23_29]|nr:MAG: fumarate hydratase [Omnitrophica WOR_2 bacterium SM23_29]
MRRVNVNRIKDVISRLAIESNIFLRKDVLRALKKAYLNERKVRAKKILKILIENAKVAADEGLAICQDTGMATVFLEIGQEVRLVGGDLEEAINDGIRQGYKKGCLRKSVVYDPLLRVNTKDNAPAVIHIKIVRGSKIKVAVSPKGFGSENKGVTKMFNPTESMKKIEEFIIGTVKAAGPDACPPFIIGIGMGGTLDKACVLAKQALLRSIEKRNPRRHIAKLEEILLKKINGLNIGPMGLGGKATCLGLNIETYPTHIAGLPVCVSISCHATRTATAVI